MDSFFETLRHDLGREVAGAEERLRGAAADIYEVAEGEVDRGYYNLVLIAAEMALRKNQKTKEQALLRRAVMLADRLGSDPEGAQARLASSTKWPEIPSALSSERIVVAIDSDCNLYGWQPQRVDFSPSTPMAYRWYMLAPLGWRSQLTERVAPMLEDIFARANARLAAREPLDANFIGVTPTHIAELTPPELLAEKWQMAPTTWLETRGFVVENNGFFFASNANDFVPMAFLSSVVAGTLDNAASIARQREVGFSGDILERQKHPAKELNEALAYYLAPK